MKAKFFILFLLIVPMPALRAQTRAAVQAARIDSLMIAVYQRGQFTGAT